MGEGDVRVWCLLGLKAGDNTQVRALADEVGLDYTEKHIVARPWELLVHLAPVASLAGIDRGASSDLSPRRTGSPARRRPGARGSSRCRAPGSPFWWAATAAAM